MNHNGHTSPAGTFNAVRFIDLFCGIGGFRYAMESVGHKWDIQTECVFSSDIDKECQRAYAANFGETPHGDITKIDAQAVPDHDILLAGFPCQPFSIMGQMKGFEDTRGTLFFDIARVLEVKQPKAFVLENVKLLKGHNHGQTLRRIRETLTDLGYYHEYRVLNALDFGLPQKRERIWIVGLREGKSIPWPTGGYTMKPLSELLEKDIPAKFYVSDHIKQRRWSVLKPTTEPTIWHENKAGHISAYPFSCALRAGASYNYLLVNGERRLTPREMLRLQGFPEEFKIICNDYQTRKQAGNSLPVNVATAVLDGVFEALKLLGDRLHLGSGKITRAEQLRLLERTGDYHARAQVENG